MPVCRVGLAVTSSWEVLVQAQSPEDSEKKAEAMYRDTGSEGDDFMAVSEEFERIEFCSYHSSARKVDRDGVD